MGFSFKKKKSGTIDPEEEVEEVKEGAVVDETPLEAPPAVEADDAAARPAEAGEGRSRSFMGMFGKKKADDAQAPEEGGDVEEAAAGGDDVLEAPVVDESAAVGGAGGGETDSPMEEGAAAKSGLMGSLFGSKKKADAPAAEEGPPMENEEGDVAAEGIELDEESMAPPPPPPMDDDALQRAILVQQNGEEEEFEVLEKRGMSRKKKLALAAVGVTAVALAIGLGAGLGSQSSANDANESGGNEAVDQGGTMADDLGATTTPATTRGDEFGTTTTVAPDFESVTTDAPGTPVPAPATATAAPTDDALASAPLYDAVIVGAGWAGLRAVATLLANDVSNVLVLEASDRVGGRAWSINADGTQNNPAMDDTVVPYDVGAGWMYDAAVNVQQDALYADGILGEDLKENDKYAGSPTWPGTGAAYYRQTVDEDGKATAARMEDGEEWLEEIWAPFLDFREENLEALGGQSYNEAIEQYLEEDGWTDDEAIQYMNLVSDSKHLEYGTGDYDLDITEVGLNNQNFATETTYMGVPGVGFGNVAAEYAKPYWQKITTGAKVTEINSELVIDAEDDAEEYVIVTYAKGGASNVIKAKTVLVTASVGVLKSGNIDFVPTLPNWKQTAIDNMGFGLINKCLMSWNDPAAMVWPEDDLWMLLATPEDETSGKWTTFNNPTSFKGVPSLTAWIGGADAIAAEEQSDEQILSDVMDNLKSMFPDITDPDTVHISRWGQEENVLGAYVYPSPGQNFEEDVEALGRRLGKIYWAGEATSADGWATTYGAWDSGEEKALEIVARLLEPVDEEVPVETEEETPV